MIRLLASAILFVSMGVWPALSAPCLILDSRDDYLHRTSTDGRMIRLILSDEDYPSKAILRVEEAYILVVSGYQKNRFSELPDVIDYDLGQGASGRPSYVTLSVAYPSGEPMSRRLEQLRQNEAGLPCDQVQMQARLEEMRITIKVIGDQSSNPVPYGQRMRKYLLPDTADIQGTRRYTREPSGGVVPNGVVPSGYYEILGQPDVAYVRCNDVRPINVVAWCLTRSILNSTVALELQSADFRDFGGLDSFKERHAWMRNFVTRVLEGNE